MLTSSKFFSRGKLGKTLKKKRLRHAKKQRLTREALSSKPVIEY